MTGTSSAFVRCRRCGHHVYHGARRCPHCGHRMHWNLKGPAVWAIALAIAILLGVVLSEVLTEDASPAPTPPFGNPSQ